MPPNPRYGAFLLIVALATFGVGLLIFGTDYIWVESTEGRVSELLWSKKSGSPMCTPVFEYEVDGATHRKERDVRESACGWSEGESLTIYYSADAPGEGYALTFFGLLPLLIGSAVGLYFLARSYRAFRGRPKTLQELVADLEIFPLSEAPTERWVGLRGTLRMKGEPLTAPISKTPCAVWEAKVYRLLNSTRVLIRHNRKISAFAIVDGEREASFAAPDEVKVMLAEDRTAKTDGYDEVLEAHLENVRVPKGSRNTSKDPFEWTEGTLSDADATVIYAVLRERDGAWLLESPEEPQGGAVVITSAGEPQRTGTSP